MRAITYTGYGPPDVLRLEEVEKPTPKDDEILVRLRATAVTTVDCIFRRGDQFAARLFTGPLRPRHSILGGQFSGGQLYTSWDQGAPGLVKSQVRTDIGEGLQFGPSRVEAIEARFRIRCDAGSSPGPHKLLCPRCHADGDYELL